MLEKERCLVCGTDAPKGSAAYNHIEKHLMEALDHLTRKPKHTPENETIKEIFKHRNIENIHQMSIQLYQYGVNIGDIMYDIEREK